MKSQAGSSRFDTVLKMLMIAFVSLLAFSTGVYFGREMTENDHHLKALESNFDDSHQVAAEKNKDYDVSEEEAIAAEDVETLTDKYVKAEHDNLADVAMDKTADKAMTEKSTAKAEHSKPAADHHDEQHAAPAAKAAVSQKAHAPAAKVRNVASAHEVKPIVKQPAHHDSDAEIAAQLQKAAKSQKPDLSQVHEAARRVASNETPSAAPKAKTESRVPSSLPKSVGAATDIEYTVQVASYPNLDEAKVHANDLVKKGFPAYPVEATIKGKTWYRVSVGSFKSMNEAGKYRTELMKQANLTSAIVQKIER
ncbi:MAG: SPOR domain-containing protein [Bdellovibrionaceae bacterium]|nr:SPOR domain-containing protein [Pseudobdellovibrionaceae bacterium]